MSPEWLQGLATGFLLLLAVYWIPWLLNRIWRNVLWSEQAADLQAVSQALDGPIRARRAGWEVRGSRGRVWLAGGFRGVRTHVWRADGTKCVEDGWPGVASIEDWLEPPPDQM